MRSISDKDYAAAFVESTSGKTGAAVDQVVANFVALLQRNHDWRRREKIFQAVQMELRRREGRDHFVVETARNLPPALLSGLEKSLGARPEDIAVKINPELVAGARITKNEEQQLDLSLAHLLQQVFQ